VSDGKKSFGETGKNADRCLQEYFNFHRIDMHNVLLDTGNAESSEEMGPQGKIVVNHKSIEVSAEKGFIKFGNGNAATADLIIAAHGIRVRFETIFRI
jgi:salicylate hydroxylase